MLINAALVVPGGTRLLYLNISFTGLIILLLVLGIVVYLLTFVVRWIIVLIRYLVKKITG